MGSLRPVSEREQQPDSVERIVEAIEALPEQIGEHVGGKLRKERLLADDLEDQRRTLRENRAHTERRGQTIREAVRDRDARMIAWCAFAVGVAGLIVALVALFA